MLNKNSLKNWFRDNGDSTFMLEHELKNDSVVVDVGAYTGVWISQMLQRYDCAYYALEPVNEFFNILDNKFKKNKKVNCLNFGISTNNETLFISNSKDASSIFSKNPSEKSQFYNFEKFLNISNLNKIDLIQINIEGMEYALLNQILDSKIILKIDKLLIQFHEVPSIDFIKQRKMIHDKMILLGYKKTFDYPFVWEGWEK